MKIFIFYTLLFTSLLSACSREATDLQDNSSPTVDSSIAAISDLSSLISALQTEGYTVQESGEIDQPFFSVPAKLLMLNQSDMQVFEYANPSAMGAESQLVDTEGSSIGTSMVSWMGTPHFYKAGRIIVIYIGEDASIIGDLQNILGPQFAGR